MIGNKPKSCIAKSRYHAVQFRKAVRTIAVVPNYYHRSAVAWFDLVVFCAGVVHENKLAGLEIEIVDGMRVPPFKMLGRCEAALEDVGVNGG